MAALALLLLVPTRAWTFAKTCTGGPANTLTVTGIGAGAFHPAKTANWLRDSRAPLIAPKPPSTTQLRHCPGNIYAASAVDNGGAVNVFFGGWDGVDSCHDSISVAVTEDDFQSFGEHVTVVATGAEMHVNNPSALKLPDGRWAMMYTQLPAAPAPPRNKPGFSMSSNGVSFVPAMGGAAQLVEMHGYAGWDAADVNGGNVAWYSTANGNAFHMFFVDFAAREHSVYHAVADANGTSPLAFRYAGVALAQPGYIPNDLKLINGHWVLGLHSNSQQTFVSIAAGTAGAASASDVPPSSWPAPNVLFEHVDDVDKYIVSIGLITDPTSNVLRGAVYGAGAVNTLDHNSVYAQWLQRRAVFRSADNSTVWGLGSATQARGPDQVLLLTNAPSLLGRFYLYDADYVNDSNPGTLLAVSPPVTVAPGDIWHISE